MCELEFICTTLGVKSSFKSGGASDDKYLSAWSTGRITAHKCYNHFMDMIVRPGHNGEVLWRHS